VNESREYGILFRANKMFALELEIVLNLK